MFPLSYQSRCAPGGETAFIVVPAKPTGVFDFGLNLQNCVLGFIRNINPRNCIARVSFAKLSGRNFEQEGELTAAIELRRRFPGIIDNAKPRERARAIAGWKPLPDAALRPRPDR
jgi:hypothetical protein